MSPSVEGPGGPLAYDEHGDGRPLLLVHGTACDRGVWRELIASLPEGVRAIAYDRRDYGDSGAPEPYGGTTVEEQADDAERVLEELGAIPALLCGHDVGALVCLELLRRRPELAVGAVLVEPPLLSLTAGGAEAMSELREAVQQGARDHGPAGAVRAYLAHVGGADAERILGKQRVRAAEAHPRAFAADLGAAPRWHYVRRDLRAVGAPVVVLAAARGGPWREPAAALAELLGNARMEEAESGHFVHVERPEAVAAAVAGVLAERGHSAPAAPTGVSPEP